jgi:hypothetical protein
MTFDDLALSRLLTAASERCDVCSVLDPPQWVGHLDGDVYGVPQEKHYPNHAAPGMMKGVV